MILKLQTVYFRQKNTLMYYSLVILHWKKILKALVVKETQQHAPYTHSLPLLVSKLSFEIPEDMNEKLAKFMEFHFEARYPEEQRKFYTKCTESFTRDNMTQIKEVFQWLSQKL